MKPGRRGWATLRDAGRYGAGKLAAADVSARGRECVGRSRRRMIVPVSCLILALLSTPRDLDAPSLEGAEHRHGSEECKITLSE
jgi:hypothetical protein